MKEKKDWPSLIKEIEGLLRLKTFPLGIKFISDEKELHETGKLRVPMKNSFTCQLLTVARTYGWSFVVTGDRLMPVCGNILGFYEAPPGVKNGRFRSIAWCKSMEDAKKFEDSIPRMPLGKYRALFLGPQVHGSFEPDIVLFYGNPAQMILIINALQFEDYERMIFQCIGESSSCAETIVQCYLSQKPLFSIPCFGERRYGHAQDDEVVMSVPAFLVEKVRRNLEALAKRGVRYPIAYFGAQADLCYGLPPAYHELLGLSGYEKPARK
jgi:uncharacterized protein (DUF169 family)